jgi:hypothetical protein
VRLREEHTNFPVYSWSTLADTPAGQHMHITPVFLPDVRRSFLSASSLL